MNQPELESSAADLAKSPPEQVLELARRIVEILADRKAADIVLLDIHALASFADYFVICSGTGERHLQALADAVSETLGHDGTRPADVEGTQHSGWILMDYADVIVHIFASETRDYYRLERLWAQAPTIVRVL